MRFLLYFHTIRYLRLTQIISRFRFRFYRPKPNLLAPPPRRVVINRWIETSSGRKQSMVAENTFVFLNESRSINTLADWNDPTVEKLWLYNLHYFDDLNAEGSESRKEWHECLIHKWIEENPPGYGNGWEPYPSSLRIVNWIKYALSNRELSSLAVNSLAIQIRFLSERIEDHLLGNHLLANAKALIFSGMFFDGKEAEEWLAKGMFILHRELLEQILTDGGHFERSPMYHSIILEDFLDIENISEVFILKSLIKKETIIKMSNWLAAMCHPDGQIGFFNDSAFGIASSLVDLNAYMERLGYSVQDGLSDGVLQLPETGYIRLQKGKASLLLDVAPIGPSYLPGHAHADTLSFELSLNDMRLLVNSGTSCYGSGLERQRQRGTAAHNTLIIDDYDSSEVWGGFRVARRAQANLLNITETSTSLSIEASHDGYKRLSGNNMHIRKWQLSEEELVVVDEVTGVFSHAEIHFHFHPDILIQQTDDNTVLLKLSDGRSVEVTVHNANIYVESSMWHPYFGVSIPNARLVAVLTGFKVRTYIRWRGSV